MSIINLTRLGCQFVDIAFKKQQIKHMRSQEEGPAPPIEMPPIIKMRQKSLLFLQFQYLPSARSPTQCKSGPGNNMVSISVTIYCTAFQ